MKTTQPIRALEDLENLKEYYRTIRPNFRNHLLIVLGLNTALRISDLISLRWGELYDLEKDRPRSHLSLREQKTGKGNRILLNRNIVEAVGQYKEDLEKRGICLEPDKFVFASQKRKDAPITRVQGFRVIQNAARACGMGEAVSCHSLRKTFGYYAWKQGISPVLLMHIYNHSSYQITKRYLGIEQEDADSVFENIQL